jgi:uncharacterized protein
MTALEPISTLGRDTMQLAADAACARISPTWPLDRLIAVNPLWERRAKTWSETAETLWRCSGTLLTSAPEAYLQAWEEGRIAERHLHAASLQGELNVSTDQLLAALQGVPGKASQLPLLEDMADASSVLPWWPDLIAHQIGQVCAAWFDQDQSDWRPRGGSGLYQAWRESLLVDRGLSVLSDCPALAGRVRELPECPDAALEESVRALGLAAEELPDWFDTLLLRSLGWASWCAYGRWQARLEGGDDGTMRELLAIRAAWEWLVDDRQRGPGSAWERWRSAWTQSRRQPLDAVWQALRVWQRAEEFAWQEKLQGLLCGEPARTVDDTPVKARVYFCIDVRSEVMRRALEQACPGVETGGFAGFFGLPIAYTPLGAIHPRPQLPGLLAAQLSVSDSSGDLELDRALTARRQARLARSGRWHLFERLPASAFALVETIGLTYAGALVGRSLGLIRPASEPHQTALQQTEWKILKPALNMIDIQQRAGMVARILRAMSLTQDFPGLVLLVGHGSQSTNNPQAAGLDCGACCGQSGEVNARLLAGLLNDGELREALRLLGIDIPDSTHFMAGLHNTTTDQIRTYDEALPPALDATWQQLRKGLDRAGELARSERAGRLGLSHLHQRPTSLLRALRQRAGDWAQTRPEWGLADNAAFIAAPRRRSLGRNLQGRVFLHDYVWQDDADGSVLELIMTAPMVVAHWINLQYLTSTTDNRRFGSGNKLLHNVVGGRIGVFEGNGGDLRIGLPRQSLHDGVTWMHTPLRLTVVLEAPQAMIDRVIAKHEVVRDLVHNDWLYLMQLDSDNPRCLQQRTASGWQALAIG